MLGYGLQADKKTLTTKPPHPDRNAQFEHINDETKKAIANGNPVLSIDAKKKENIGNFKNNGRTYQPHKTPIEVLDHLPAGRQAIFPYVNLAKLRHLAFIISLRTKGL
jgi:hypothetical protein